MRDESTFDLVPILNLVRTQLQRADDRIADKPTFLKLSWWPRSPSFDERLTSDYGSASGQPALTEEFFDEVTAIQEALEKLGIHAPPPSWMGRSEVAQRLGRSLNQRATALGIWDQVAIPVRFRNNQVFRIWAPDDVMGTPIVDSMSVSEYVRLSAENSAQTTRSFAACKSKLKRWQSVSVGLAIILGFFVAHALNFF